MAAAIGPLHRLAAIAALLAAAAVAAPAVADPTTESPPWWPAVSVGIGVRRINPVDNLLWRGVSVRFPALYPFGVLVDVGMSDQPLYRFDYVENLGYSTEHFRRPYFRAGAGYRDRNIDFLAGVGIVDDELSGFGRFTVFLGPWLARIGVHDGGDVLVPGEVVRLTGGYTWHVGAVPVDVSAAVAAMSTGDEITAAPTLGLGAVWHRVRVGAYLSTAAATFSLGFDPVPPPTERPAPLPPAPEPVTDPTIGASPAFAAMATEGRELTFATKGLAAPMSRCQLVQRIDFAPEGRPVALLRFVCTDAMPEADTAPYDGPLLVRTGCYALDMHGLWRLPACPDSASASMAVRRTLVVPSAAALRGSTGRFYELARRYQTTRTVTVDGKPVVAYCAKNFLPNLAEVCASDELGLLWARTAKGQGAWLASQRAVEVPAEETSRFAALTSGDLACSLSSACAAFGQCHQIRGKCVATGHQDCAAAWCCSNFGACTALGGDCLATSEAECAASEACKIRGRCVPKAWQCRALKPEHCALSANCRDLGRCTLVGSECAVGSDEDCQRHAGCLAEGLCARNGAVCEAVGDEMCKLSAACTGDGRCRAEDGRCVK